MVILDSKSKNLRWEETVNLINWTIKLKNSNSNIINIDKILDNLDYDDYDWINLYINFTFILNFKYKIFKYAVECYQFY